MTMGKRIAEARKQRGWSQEQLANLLSRSQSALAAWEKDKHEPSREDVGKLATLLGVTRAHLEGTDSFIAEGEIGFIVPVLNWVSAGSVTDVESLEAAGASQLIRINDLPPGTYFATEVRGDSMDRISPEGSMIVVNIADKRLISNKPYVFALGSGTTYKLFRREPVMRLEPYSTNPVHDPIFLQDPDWRVVGRVVRSWIDLG